ncbi:PhoX family phosphatase [Sphingomonas psychrotolerans]|uniref:PhoX family phosphatase n=1 Tax=Sphingomonas psychrotolerans TaxID=1327635 RepID=A0ABU3MXQ6_9SPHN|nr:alkaline phosphatase PhoX [Sphingomonas psychrotolerans]MDT8757105.1 PhoX family phosphatase [Sphingomonas psychrotolerans]
MNDLTPTAFGYTDGDVDTNNSGNVTLNELAAQRLSRRQTLRGGSAIVAATLGSSVLAACDSADVENAPAPSVSAGAATTTTAGRIVTLTGTSGDGAAVSWTQTGGPAVTLNGATGNTVTFLAPSVASATVLTFQFAAANGSAAATATTTVTVNPAQLGFAAVAKNKLDVVTVPAGYKVQVINRTGDPIAATVPAYKNDGTDTNFAQRIGDHGDALYWYGLAATGTARDATSSTRGLIVQNHENINIQYLHPAGPTNNTTAGPRPEAEAIKEIECHGVSVTEAVEGANRSWSVVQGSTLNRRITPNTPVVFSGPAKGSDLLKTLYSTTGTAGRGTINNCANGTTPWGTAITCEENWAGYFRRPSADVAGRSAKELTALSRYGVTGNGNFSWATVVPADSTNTIFRRWNATVSAGAATGDFRNEPNQFGWVVEIDPYDPTKAPRKRTALGRLGHEGCWPGNFVAGRKPAWYMGDDSRREYLYKFVSATAWVAADATATDRLAIGDKYLDAGTLYVAKFNADGTGTWLPLIFGQNGIDGTNPAYAFADQADVLVNARLAADKAGATPMDRPEWTAVNPVTGEVYLTLTNNNAAGRPLNGTDAANPRHYSDPFGPTNTAQFGNPNGHIIRLKETGDTTEATSFAWDIYLFGAGADLDAANINISGLTADQDFSSPDGLYFSRPTNAAGQVKPLLWIETDDGAYTDVTNCMLLAAMPGGVGDGGARTITNTGTGGVTATQATRVGAAPTAATLKRFLVGPVECEITGIDTTPDGRTIFVGIQHPGEGGTPAAPTSHWPDSQATGTAGAAVRPRSAVVVITKDDGGVVGL